MDGELITEISTHPPLPAKKEAEANDRMNLLFITHSGVSEPHDRREIARRAQRNASIKRKQARQVEAARKPKATRLFGDFRHRDEVSSKPSSNSQEWLPATSVATGVDAATDDRAISVRTYLDTSKADPFNTGAVPMNREMHSVFMWYFNVILPVVEPMPSEREDYSRWAVPLLSTEPVLLYSLLACMAHDIEQATVVGFGPPTRRNMTTERLHYRIRAVQELNDALADSKAAMKPSTLLAVHFLLWQEVCHSSAHSRLPLVT
jgi:Fungal specific transcription factor domain